MNSRKKPEKRGSVSRKAGSYLPEMAFGCNEWVRGRLLGKNRAGRFFAYTRENWSITPVFAQIFRILPPHSSLAGYAPAN